MPPPLALLLALPLALAAEPPTCAPLVPVTFDNTTIPGVSPVLSFPISQRWQLWVQEGVLNPNSSSMFISLPAHACFPKKTQGCCTGA